METIAPMVNRQNCASRLPTRSEVLESVAVSARAVATWDAYDCQPKP